MKNNWEHYLHVTGIRKILCTLQLAALLLIGAVVEGQAIGYAQNVVFSFKLKQATFEDLMKEIRQRSDYYFIYKDADVEGVNALNEDFEQVDIHKILQECLKGTGLVYTIEDHLITIKRGSSKAQENQTVQQQVISGTVKDKQGQPLPGVTVKLKGTSLGVITDAAGKYRISLPQQKDIILIFSFVGMKKKEVAVKEQKVINLVLEEDNAELEEVVVTGIFERKASSFTGSAVSMTKDQLMKVSNQNLFQSLKNLEPSLMIFDDLNNGSNPNKLPDMQLRGTSAFPESLDASDLKGNYTNNPNLPLFILDGFEASVEKIFDLDMNRIESVTILKDAAAKAIYGSKAANGVVVVETKHLTSGNLRVTYNGSMDLTAPDLSSYNLCNAEEKLAVELASGMYEDESGTLASELRLKELYNKRLQAVASGVNTDWMAKPLRNGIGHKHNLTIELGNENLRLVVDFGYNQVTGVMKGSDRNNLSGQISISYRHKALNFRDVLSVTANNSNDSPYGSFSEYSKMNPYWSPVNEAGNLVENADIIEGIGWNGTEFFPNPLYNSQLDTKLSSEYVDVTNNFYIEWFVLKGLKATARFGITKKHNKADQYYPANHLKFKSVGKDEQFRKGSYQINEGDNKRLSGDFNINFSRQFAEKHYLFGNVGWNLSENIYEEVIYKAEGFPSDRMNNILFARQYAKDSKPSGKEGTVRDMGVLSVLNYSFDERFLLDASYRINGSSQFGRNNRWGSFWSVGVGWNVHNEAFIKKLGLFDQLKLRGSVGYTGSQAFDSYQSLATYSYYMDKTYNGFLGTYLMGMVNDDLKWQRKLDYNAGLDVFLMRKLSLKLDYYISITDNTLIDFTLPTSTGFTGVKENVGRIRNTGIEARLNWTVWSEPADRTYISFNASIAHNKNKILAISDALKHYNELQDIASVDRFSGRAIRKYYEGYSMNTIWACPSLGIDPANGREVYVDKDGVPTYTYNTGNLVACGDNLPKVTGNAGFNVQFKGVELNCVFRYQVGAKLYNQTLVNRVEGCDINYNVDRRVLEGRWQHKGDLVQYRALPKVWVQEEQVYKVAKTYPTTRFVQKRNELDLSSINLSYDFYRWKFIQQARIERLKISFYMNDVFKLSSIRTERGLDYPFARTFNFALQVSF